MGLGKTFISIAYICHTMRDRKVGDSVLVVVPMGLLPTWLGEIEKRVRPGSISSLLVYGPKTHASRRQTLQQLRKYHIVLTTPDYIHNQWQEYDQAQDEIEDGGKPNVPKNGWPLIGHKNASDTESPWTKFCLCVNLTSIVAKINILIVYVYFVTYSKVFGC